MDAAAAAQARELCDERCGHDFVVLAADFDLMWGLAGGFEMGLGGAAYGCEDAPVFGG